MSLAPASSRGAFLKARLAVNGIQCAARSFGTLTPVGCGLLSSMVDLLRSWTLGFWRSPASYQLDGGTGTPEPFYLRYLRPSGRFWRHGSHRRQLKTLR